MARMLSSGSISSSLGTATRSSLPAHVVGPSLRGGRLVAQVAAQPNPEATTKDEKAIKRTQAKITKKKITPAAEEESRPAVSSWFTEAAKAQDVPIVSVTRGMARVRDPELLLSTNEVHQTFAIVPNWGIIHADSAGSAGCLAAVLTSRIPTPLRVTSTVASRSFPSGRTVQKHDFHCAALGRWGAPTADGRRSPPYHPHRTSRQGGGTSDCAE